MDNFAFFQAMSTWETGYKMLSMTSYKIANPATKKEGKRCVCCWELHCRTFVRKAGMAYLNEKELHVLVVNDNERNLLESRNCT